MTHEFKHPIIGQEAICSDGLGRVKDFKDAFPEQWIQIDTYYNNCSSTWSPKSVILINPNLDFELDYQDHLLELLAVIHRDGGHYTNKYGIEKAVADAKQIISDLIVN